MGSLSALEKANAKCQWQHKENTRHCNEDYKVEIFL
jgi:hypothetical protein